MSNQPIWKLLWSTDYSALYTDETGVYPPELQIAQTDDDAGITYVYRFPLDRCWQVTDDDGSTFLTDMNPERATRTGDPFKDLPYPLSHYVPWFRNDLGNVASSVGRSVAEIVGDLCSDDPSRLAHAYEDIGGYHGFDNFDSSPEEWTEHEFSEWPERGEKYDPADREAFIEGYISCALWCGVMDYKHVGECPLASDPDMTRDACNCDPYPEMISSCDEHDESDLTDAARATLTKDAGEFYDSQIEDLHACGLDMERAGHNFWLTRNRHGAGFWNDKGGDRDNRALDRLTDASHPYGECSLEVREDGKIGVM